MSLFSPFCQAQNLVLNPSFEEYNNLFCGVVHNKADMAHAMKYWTMPTNGTSDIFSTKVEPWCYSQAVSSTFLFAVGSQAPRTGQFMAGIITYLKRDPYPPSGWREYLQAPLKEPLKPGERYWVGMWVSLADSAEYASDNLGLYFSERSMDETFTTHLNVQPQVNSSAVVADKQNWVLVGGTFIAKAPAQFLIIGNFFDDQDTKAVKVRDKTKEKVDIRHQFAYYFIDDVFVEPFPKLVVPNIFTPNGDGYNDIFRIEGLHLGMWRLRVYNRWGRQVYGSEGYKNDWDGGGLSEGVYFYELSRPYIGDRYSGPVTIVK